MKAKEYVEKYANDLNSRDEKCMQIAANNMLNELYTECKETAKKRSVRTDAGWLSVFKEQNNKYNAIARCFPGILIQDGFKLVCMDMIPLLKTMW